MSKRTWYTPCLLSLNDPDQTTYHGHGSYFSGKILSDQNKNTVLFAEAASCQLEFKYLAKLTGKKEYYERVRVSNPSKGWWTLYSFLALRYKVL